jgi:hypothetical protein
LSFVDSKAGALWMNSQKVHECQLGQVANGNRTPILSKALWRVWESEFGRVWCGASMLSLPDVASFQSLSNVVRECHGADRRQIELHRGYGAVAHPVWHGKIGMDFAR